MRGELCEDALRLGRILAELLPGEAVKSMPSASLAKRDMRSISRLFSSRMLRPARFVVDSSRSLQRRSRQSITPTRQHEEDANPVGIHPR